MYYNQFESVNNQVMRYATTSKNYSIAKIRILGLKNNLANIQLSSGETDIISINDLVNLVVRQMGYLTNPSTLRNWNGFEKVNNKQFTSQSMASDFIRNYMR